MVDYLVDKNGSKCDKCTKQESCLKEGVITCPLGLETSRHIFSIPEVRGE